MKYCITLVDSVVTETRDVSAADDAPAWCAENVPGTWVLSDMLPARGDIYNPDGTWTTPFTIPASAPAMQGSTL